MINFEGYGNNPPNVLSWLSDAERDLK